MIFCRLQGLYIYNDPRGPLVLMIDGIGIFPTYKS